MTWRDSFDGVAGLPLEPPDPAPRYVRTCTARGCDGGVIYAGRATLHTGDATLTGGEDWAYCARCGGSGTVPA